MNGAGTGVALGRLDKLQPLLLILSIGAGLALAAVAPGPASSLLPLVPVGVFVLIYLVMLGVDVRGVAKAFSNVTFLTTAVLINFVVNPLLAWGLGALFLRDHPDLWVGLILFLVTPCIGWYLIFTELAHGNVQLGVSLLGINIALQVALLPLYLYLLAGQVVGIDLGTVLRSVAYYLVGPLVLAALTRSALRRTGHSVEHVQQRLRMPYLKTATLMAVIIAMFASQAEVLFANPGVVLVLIPPIVIFFCVAFGVAIATGRLLRMRYAEVALLVFTTTSRNSEASLAIAATAFASPLVALTVVIGPSIELPLLVVMVRVLLWLRQRYVVSGGRTWTVAHSQDVPRST